MDNHDLQPPGADAPTNVLVDRIDPEIDRPTATGVGAAAGETTTIVDRLPELPGYELGELLGEGGMGIVHRAKEMAFGRDVAVKFLKQRFVSSEVAVQRFQEEARITGQLQHPGIPPVHVLGTIRGRPYLVMKLIRGETLHKLIEDGRGREPAIFEAVCQALAYAHARNLLHRDLKPSNIMVGAFGQVQVMDWGLAKVIRDREPTDPPASGNGTTSVHSPQEPRASCTQEGSAIGTPAYMPPEQAAGDLELIDRRSDVFGLGAVLCAMLTGKPPYTGSSSDAIRSAAIAGRLAPAFRRLDECRGDPELIALCKHCLSFAQSARPANAGVVADEVARIRIGGTQRLTNLEIEKQTSEVRSLEQQKRRKVMLRAGCLIAAVLVIGLIGTTGSLLSARQEASAAREAETKERDSRQVAEAARDEASRHYRLALEGYTQMVFAVQDKLEGLPGTSAARKFLLVRAQEGLRDLLADRPPNQRPDHVLIWAHLKLGDLQLFFTQTRKAEAEYLAAHNHAVALYEAEPDKSQAKRDLAESLLRLGDTARKTVGRHSEAEAFYLRSEAIAAEEANAQPDELPAVRLLANVRSRRGIQLMELHKPIQAVPVFTDVHDLRIRLAKMPAAAKPEQRAVSESRLNLANALLLAGDSKRAGEHFEQCCRAGKLMMEKDPEDSRFTLDYTVACHRYGDFLYDKGEYPDAEVHFAEAVRCNEQLAKGDPDHDGFRRNLAVSLEKIGDVLIRKRDFAGVKKHFQRSLEYRLASVAADASDVSAQRDLAVSYAKMGVYWNRVHRDDESLVHYRRSSEIFTKLASADKERVSAHFDRVLATNSLADAYARCHDFEEAIQHYNAALLLVQELLDKQSREGTEVGRDRAKYGAQKLAAKSGCDFSTGCMKGIEDVGTIVRQPTMFHHALFVARMRFVVNRRNAEAVRATLNACERLADQRSDLDFTMAVLAALAASIQPDPPTRTALTTEALNWLAKDAQTVVPEELATYCAQIDDEVAFRILEGHPEFQKLMNELRTHIPGVVTRP